MEKEQNKFIFDMDGTLYSFDKGKGQTFTSSRFYNDMRTNVYSFFSQRRGITQEEAMIEYERIKDKYKGEVSLGVEAEYNIDRYEFFNNTWNLKPEQYIEKDMDLPEMLIQLKGRIALLTAAPRIWAVNVLAHLNIAEAFEGRLYTGEPDERKPNPVVFRRIADDFGTEPGNVISIGDQEHSDIIPAKSVGMKAILIGQHKDTIADYTVSDVKSAIRLLRNEGFI